MLDLRYGQEERLAMTLSRLCYPIALSMEDRMPASALRLLEASHRTHQYLNDTLHPFGRDESDREVANAVLSAKCTRAILRNVQKEAEHRKETPREAPRIAAALEIAERLLEGLEDNKGNHGTDAPTKREQ